MPGLRIHHLTLRSATLLVPHPSVKLGRARDVTYPVHIDADGNSIVSGVVWRRLLECKTEGLSMHEFIVLNEVESPPAISVDLNGSPDKARTFVQRGWQIYEHPDRVPRQRTKG